MCLIPILCLLLINKEVLNDSDIQFHYKTLGNSYKALLANLNYLTGGNDQKQTKHTALAVQSKGYFGMFLTKMTGSIFWLFVAPSRLSSPSTFQRKNQSSLCGQCEGFNIIVVLRRKMLLRNTYFVKENGIIIFTTFS